MAFDASTFRARIDLLGALDPNSQIFGAMRHRWRFSPALGSGEVLRFGGLIGSELPADYRRYLVELGNGGAGPYYGIEPLEIWEQGGSHPSRPFSLMSAYKNGDALPEGAHPHDGCIRLSEIGCGYQAFLVVRGDRAGEVWDDYLAGDGDFAKVADDFGSWMHRWADQTLRQTVFEAIDAALLDPPWKESPALIDASAAVDELLDESAGAWLEQAMAAAYRGDREQARAATERAEPDLDFTKWIRGRATLAGLWVALGELGRAREVVAPALSEARLDFQTRAACTVAMALATEGDATEAWVKAREARPFELSNRVRLALSHERAGRSKEADSVLAEAAREVRLFDGGTTREGNSLKRAVYERMAALCAHVGLDGARFIAIATEVPKGPSGWGNPGNTKSW